MSNETQKISRKSEVIRFIITGLVCAIADFLVTELFLFILKDLKLISL